MRKLVRILLKNSETVFNCDNSKQLDCHNRFIHYEANYWEALDLIVEQYLDKNDDKSESEEKGLSEKSDLYSESSSKSSSSSYEDEEDEVYELKLNQMPMKSSPAHKRN